MKSARVLLTGGAGFIGLGMVRRLLDSGASVTVVDDLSRGRLDDDAAAVFSRPGIDFVQADLADRSSLDGLGADFETIVHLAAVIGIQAASREPVRVLRTNALSAITITDFWRRCRARMVFASTSEVYGDPLVNPQPESYWGNVNPIGVRGVYDEAKRFAEALVMAYHRYHGVDTRIARIFNTYGPRMRPRDGRVVSNFIVQALRGENLTVYGTGAQTRSFCFVDDEIDGLARLLLAPESDDVHLPVNIGNPHELTVLEIAETILRLSGSSSRIVFEPLPEDDPKVRRPDISRARHLLGWEPRVALEEGLRRTIEYFRSALGDEA